VDTADDGSVGPYRVMSADERTLRYRHDDDTLYALGCFLESLAPPRSPNPATELSRRGALVFDAPGCAACHPPPLYTNNRLVPVEGFTPPRDDPSRRRLHVLDDSVGTDPGLALKTRKGTGYYKVPSLRGVWARGLLEHSGSVASLEEWFDRKRLRDDHVPGGWIGPGVKHRAVKGHEFGLDLAPEEKSALIAFLKTL